MSKSSRRHFQYIAVAALFANVSTLCACDGGDEASQTSSPAAGVERELTQEAASRPAGSEEKPSAFFDPSREAETASAAPRDDSAVGIRRATREDRDGYYEARRRAESR